MFEVFSVLFANLYETLEEYSGASYWFLWHIFWIFLGADVYFLASWAVKYL